MGTVPLKDAAILTFLSRNPELSTEEREEVLRSLTEAAREIALTMENEEKQREGSSKK